MSPKSKRRRLDRHGTSRSLLCDNAEAAVDRWESGALSTVKFDLLEATISEGEVPSNPEEFHAHAEDTQARFAGMAELSNADRKATTLKLLHSIQRRDYCSKEKRTWAGHKSALRAFAKFRLAQGHKDERLHCAAEIPDSHAVARHEMRVFLEWMFTGGIRFRDGERKLKTCRRYAMSVIQAHGRLNPPIDLTFLHAEVTRWSDAAEMVQIRSVGVTASFEKSAFDKSIVQRLCEADWSEHIRQGNHPPKTIRRLGIVLKSVVQCLYQCMFRRGELLRDRAEFNIRLHCVRASITWYDTGGDEIVPSRKNLLALKASGGYCTLKNPQLKNDKKRAKYARMFNICPITKDGRVVCCGNWLLELELDNVIEDPEIRRTTPLWVDPRCGLPLTKAVFDYALVRMLVVTDPRRRTWLEMRIEYGTHSFRIGGKNDMERIDLSESAQMNFMRSTDVQTARGYNRMIALLGPRIAAVLRYTDDANRPGEAP